MRNRNIIFATIVVLSVVAGSTFAMVTQERKPRTVQRVSRPLFTKRDWDGIYFENLFEQGLVGDRPSAGQIGSKPTVAADDNDPNNDPPTQPMDNGLRWSQVITTDVLENEIKTLQQSLVRDITTPVRFKSEYLKIRQSFSMLSLMFAIIREYDNDNVRWKKYAPMAQFAFARSAAASRVGSEQAYQNAKFRKDDLVELVRGGSFALSETPPEMLEWPLVVDRNPMMVRLQLAIERLKPTMSNKTEFTKNIQLVIHEASIVAAIGEVLGSEGMDEADEEEYAEFAKAMTDAAIDVVAAAKNQDYSKSAASANLIEQSCSNCHEEWR